MKTLEKEEHTDLEDILSLRLPKEAIAQYRYLSKNKYNITKLIRAVVIENIAANYRKIAKIERTESKEPTTSQSRTWTPV